MLKLNEFLSSPYKTLTNVLEEHKPTLVVWTKVLKGSLPVSNIVWDGLFEFVKDEIYSSQQKLGIDPTPISTY